MTDQNYGYGEVEAVAKETRSNSKYLVLEDGKAVRLRIASRPRYVIRHFVEADRQFVPHTPGLDENEKPLCTYCLRGIKKDAQWGWIIIDRLDNKVKIWKATNKAAFLIRDITKLLGRKDPETGIAKPIWGDPTTFDIVVKKTKQSSGFPKWEINPDPDHADPLTEQEKKMVKDSNYDLEQDMANSKFSEHVGNYGNADLETAPEDKVNPDDIPDNLGESSTSGVDEIPF